MLDRHSAELENAINNDKTGSGFIYQMFLSEMENHEYGYTGDPDDTLYALGNKWEDIEKDEKLMNGFSKASKKILKY